MPKVIRLISFVIFMCARMVGAGVIADIEYGKAGDVSLRLDASVPEGNGPFPVAILVHGGGWSRGDKQDEISTLFASLTEAQFTWFSINYRLTQSLHLQARLKACGVPCDLLAIETAPHAIMEWQKISASYKDKMIAWLKRVLS